MHASECSPRACDGKTPLAGSALLIRRGYVDRLRPTREQAAALARTAGACRWVWNTALARQRDRLAAGEFAVGYNEMAGWLTDWRAEHDWLREPFGHALQQALKDLDRALKDSFRKAGDPAKKRAPRFRRRGDGDSFRCPDLVSLRDLSGRAEIKVPKIGWIRHLAHRPVPGRICQATFRQDRGHWVVAIQTEREIALLPPPAADVAPIGIDLGVARLATLSDGTILPALADERRIAARLRRQQRTLSRRKRGSKRWTRQCRRVAALKARAARQRRDALHKATTAIAAAHRVVAIEDLAVGRMTRSARGTAEAPGTNVRAKAGLNRSILEQGWGTFRQLLAYKVEERGGRLVAVDPRNTSRTCPACGHVAAENRPSQAVFACTACGHAAHADLVAAINIARRAAGLAVPARGGTAQGQGPQRPDEAGIRTEGARHAA